MESGKGCQANPTSQGMKQTEGQQLFLRVPRESTSCRDKLSSGEPARLSAMGSEFTGLWQSVTQSLCSTALPVPCAGLFPQQTVIRKTENICSQTRSSVWINRNNPIHCIRLHWTWFYREAAGRKAGSRPQTPQLWGAGAEIDTQRAGSAPCSLSSSYKLPSQHWRADVGEIMSSW